MFYGVEDMTLEFFIGVPLIVIAAIIVYKRTIIKSKTLHNQK